MWGGVGVCVLKDGFKLVVCFPCPPKNLTAMSKLFQNATPLSAHRNMHYLKLFCMLLLLRRSRARDDHIKCLPTISSFSFYWGGLTPAHWSCSLQTTLLQTAQYTWGTWLSTSAHSTASLLVLSNIEKMSRLLIDPVLPKCLRYQVTKSHTSLCPIFGPVYLSGFSVE